jgi:hypothetical protein
MITFWKEKAIYDKKRELNTYLLYIIIITNIFNIIYSYYVLSNIKVPETLILINLLIYILIVIIFIQKAHEIKRYAENQNISLHDMKIYNKKLIILFIITSIYNVSINIIQKNVGLMIVRSVLSIIFLTIILSVYKFLY